MPDTLPHEPVGQQPSLSDFNTAMTHFYRGEVYRSSVWRIRLDATTNWAVVATAASLSFAFSETHHTQLMFIITSLLVTLLLSVEARRFRIFDAWRERVRLLEVNFMASHLLGRPFSKDDEWRHILARDLFHPYFKMSLLEAFARRLRRNYIWIFVIIYLSWVSKLCIHPYPASSFAELLSNISVNPFLGLALFILFTGYNACLLALAVWVSFRRPAWGEIQDPNKGFAWLRDDEPEHMAELFKKSRGEDGDPRHHSQDAECSREVQAHDAS